MPNTFSVRGVRRKSRQTSNTHRNTHKAAPAVANLSRPTSRSRARTHTHHRTHTTKFRARIYGGRPDATTIRRPRRRHYYTKTCVHATQKKILERRKETRSRRKKKNRRKTQTGSTKRQILLSLLRTEQGFPLSRSPPRHRAAAGCVGTEKPTAPQQAESRGEQQAHSRDGVRRERKREGKSTTNNPEPASQKQQARLRSEANSK